MKIMTEENFKGIIETFKDQLTVILEAYGFPKLTHNANAKSIKKRWDECYEYIKHNFRKPKSLKAPTKPSKFGTGAVMTLDDVNVVDDDDKPPSLPSRLPPPPPPPPPAKAGGGGKSEEKKT